jgi:hypothetical protein
MNEDRGDYLANASRTEYGLAMRFKGDSAFVGYTDTAFQIEGVEGTHLAQDINYYYVGFVTAAAGRSPFLLKGYIELHNLRQAWWRKDFYDVGQIYRAIPWATRGYNYYNSIDFKTE